jgi:hypothetical protein
VKRVGKRVGIRGKEVGSEFREEGINHLLKLFIIYLFTLLYLLHLLKLLLDSIFNIILRPHFLALLLG